MTSLIESPGTAPLPMLGHRRSSNARKYLMFAGIPVLGLAAFAGFGRLAPPVSVRTSVAVRGDVVREVYGRATIESRRRAKLGFDLVGRLADVLVDEGDRVRAGQVVAHLAAQQENIDAYAASSGVSLVKAATARLEANERRAQATLTFLEADTERTRKLAASGSVPPRNLEVAEQELGVARAEMDRIHAEQVESRRQIAVATATTESKAVTVRRASLMSPFDGLVTRRLKDPGDPIVVGSTVLEVIPLDRLWARASIDESMIAALHEGMAAEVTLFSDSAKPLRGTIDRIGSEVDRQTHEALVDILLAETPSPITVGQRADAYIAVARHSNVVRIPIAFVRHDSGGQFVYADRGGRIARVSIVVGTIGRSNLEVTSGLEPGETVLDSLAPASPLPVGRRWKAQP